MAAQPSIELALWDLLDAAARKDERAKQRCQDLKLDWQRKDESLGRLQRGVLIRWLDDHPDVLDQIRRHVPPPDAGAPTKDDAQPSSRMLPITREWFQYLSLIHI